ncbi:MAG TPA: 2-dehydropantoate 2-reductase [Bacillota bacterium]|nr:2-dehydropantoate 2-reductase [Bacillota bacterium]
MQLTIVGAGAIGGVAGAYLAQAGHDITLVDREVAHVEAINRDGLRISGYRGELRLPMRAITPEQLQGPLHRVILAVKAQHTAAALAPVAALLADDGFVLSMQNGLNEEVIAARIGAARTVGCFVHYGADYQEPGHILLGNEQPIYIGELDGSDTSRLHELQAALSAIMPAIITDNIWSYLWGKLCYGALVFTGALLDQPTHVLLAMPEFRPLLFAVVRETALVAAAQGCRLMTVGGVDPTLYLETAPDARERVYAVWDRQVQAHATSRSLKVFTGIQRDIMVRRRPTEVDGQMGPVLEHGARLGMPMPLLHAVTDMLHEVEQGKRPLGVENFRELAARAAPYVA